MTREEFMTNRAVLANEGWIPFGKMDEDYKKLLRSAPMDQIQILTADGDDWCSKDSDTFYGGWIYRINPNWSGPVEPAKPKHTDSKVFVENSIYRFIDQVGDCAFITVAPAMAGFAGYVYGSCIDPHLLFDQKYDGEVFIGYTLRVPDAVRFLNT